MKSATISRVPRRSRSPERGFGCSVSAPASSAMSASGAGCGAGAGFPGVSRAASHAAPHRARFPAHGDLRPRQDFLQPLLEKRDVAFISQEQAAQQSDIRRIEPQPARHRVRVIGQRACGRVDHHLHFRVALRSRFEHHRSEARHGHLVRAHRPVHQVREPVQREGAQDFFAEGRYTMFNIVTRQRKPQPVHRDIVAAAGVAEELPPAARFFNPAGPAPRHPAEPVPAITRMPSPSPNAVANPESRSLPAVTRAEGHVRSTMPRSCMRSSSVAHPPRGKPRRMSHRTAAISGCAPAPAW